MAVVIDGLKLSIKDYAKRKGHQCPFCLDEGNTWILKSKLKGATDIQYPTATRIYQHRACTSCGEEWQEEFRLNLEGLKQILPTGDPLPF